MSWEALAEVMESLLLPELEMWKRFVITAQPITISTNSVMREAKTHRAPSHLGPFPSAMIFGRSSA